MIVGTGLTEIVFFLSELRHIWESEVRKKGSNKILLLSILKDNGQLG